MSIKPAYHLEDLMEARYLTCTYLIADRIADKVQCDPTRSELSGFELKPHKRDCLSRITHCRRVVETFMLSGQRRIACTEISNDVLEIELVVSQCSGMPWGKEHHS